MGLSGIQDMVEGKSSRSDSTWKHVGTEKLQEPDELATCYS